MSRYARIVSGRVAEIITLPDEMPPSEAFHPSVAATLVACPDTSVVEGWAYSAGTFSAPAPVPTPVPGPRMATGYALLMALSDDEAKMLKPRDMARLSGRSADYIPETSAFVARVAGVVGHSPDEWFDTALAA